jgi:hypothetical protein
VHPGCRWPDLHAHTLGWLRLITEISAVTPAARRSLAAAEIIPPRPAATGARAIAPGSCAAISPWPTTAAATTTEITPTTTAALATATLVTLASTGSLLTRLEFAPLIFCRCGFVDVRPLGPRGTQGKG